MSGLTPLEAGPALPYHPGMTQSMPGSEMGSVATLRWLVEAGADEAIGEVPINRFRKAAGPAALPA
ncbi:MAG TPA: hypothetical protein VIY09_08260, partial [Rhizomicrobium sp.]